MLSRADRPGRRGVQHLPRRGARLPRRGLRGLRRRGGRVSRPARLHRKRWRVRAVCPASTSPVATTPKTRRSRRTSAPCRCGTRRWARSRTPRAPTCGSPSQSRRGCPNDCSYCSTSRIQGRRLRARDPREVAEHVAMLGRAGYRRVYFVDNSFNIPEQHALDLCDALSRLAAGVEWRCILYPHRVPEELVRRMAQAGCVEVSLGFESGSPRVLREMNKRFTPADVREISDLLAAHGIRRMGLPAPGRPRRDPRNRRGEPRLRTIAWARRTPRHGRHPHLPRDRAGSPGDRGRHDRGGRRPPRPALLPRPRPRAVDPRARGTPAPRCVRLGPGARDSGLDKTARGADGLRG